MIVYLKPGMVTAPPTTADGMSRPQTVSQEIVPSKLRPGLNVYHPKPIPPPEMLPLTRTVSGILIYFLSVITQMETLSTSLNPLALNFIEWFHEDYQIHLNTSLKEI